MSVARERGETCKIRSSLANVDTYLFIMINMAVFIYLTSTNLPFYLVR